MFLVPTESRSPGVTEGIYAVCQLWARVVSSVLAQVLAVRTRTIAEQLVCEFQNLYIVYWLEEKTIFIYRYSAAVNSTYHVSFICKHCRSK